MKKLKLISIFLSGTVVISTAVGCNSSYEKKSERTNIKSSKNIKNTQKIKDMMGQEVELSNQINTTGTSWPGFCSVIYTIGADKKLKAVPKALENYNWVYKIFPNTKEAIPIFNGKETNIEELVRISPDVLFLRNKDEVEKIKSTGIPVLMINYKNNNISDINESVLLAGKALGEKEEKRSKDYFEYVNEKLKKIKEKALQIDSKKKKKILYLTFNNSKSISVWGKNMPQTEAIEMAGGINVAASEIDGFKEISPEQIILWNPDIIIAETKDKNSEIYENEVFSSLDAVKSQKVYTSPVGIFSWTRLGTESVLQTQWIAKIMYPDIYSEIDIRKEIKQFYKKFFEYKLTDKEVDLILEANKPM